MDRFFNLNWYPECHVERYHREIELAKQNNTYEIIEQILEEKLKYAKCPMHFKLSVLSYLVQHTYYELCEILHKWTKINQGVTTDMFADFDETLNKYQKHNEWLKKV